MFARQKLLCALLVAFCSVQGAELGSFQGGSGAWQLGTLAVGDVVGDAQAEIVIPYREAGTGLWKLDAFDWRGNRLAGFPYNGLTAPINVSPTLYDIDGDGTAEIFFTAGAAIVALKGNGAVLWTKPVSAANYVPDSGFHAVTNGFHMTPTGLFLPTLPPQAQFFSEVSSPIVSDVAGNGTLEVLTAWKINPDPILRAQDYNPFINDYFGAGEWGSTGESWSGGVIGVNARTGASTLTYHFHQLVEAGLAIGQADADPAREVYVLNDADGVAAFDRTQPHGFFGKGMLHGMFGKNQRMLSGSYLTGVDVHAADIDGDGRDEVLVASSQINPNWQASETILDDDGAIIWRRWLDGETSFPETHGWFNSATMIPVNPDRDNQPDVFSFTHSTAISFRSWNGVELVERAGWPKDFAPRLPTPPVVGDVDGDGQEEIIIGTYDPAANPSNGSLHIFALNGSEKLNLPVPGGLKHIPAIGDVNGDGAVEVIYRGMNGRVYVQNFGSKAGARVSWATHRGNMRRDGNMGVKLLPPGVTPPVRVAEFREGNLIGNGGFEENDNSHWDKWFTGDIPWTRMTATTNEAFAGAKSMEIKLVNDRSQSSITQFSHYGAPESYLKTTPGKLYSFGGYIRSSGLTAATEHWFEWDSSRTGEHPGPRPGLPWPSYFTPAAKIGAEATPWTYLNRVFTMPEGFPNVELRHRFRVDGQASGSVFLDNVFFVELPALDDARWADVMPFGQTWKYVVDAPVAEWSNVGFNDAAWLSGLAKFGAGSGPRDIRTALPGRKPAYYFRRTFTLGAANFSTLLLAATCTDDYGGKVHPMRVWLNGTEIITSGIEAVTGEGNQVKYFDLTAFAGLLRANQANTIAVLLQNTWASDWDNVAFDVGLRAVNAATSNQAQITGITANQNGTATLHVAGPAGTPWTLEAIEGNGQWRTVQSILFPASAVATITDDGQNGRGLPAATSSRLYRLRSN